MTFGAERLNVLRARGHGAVQELRAGDADGAVLNGVGSWARLKSLPGVTAMLGEMVVWPLKS